MEKADLGRIEAMEARLDACTAATAALDRELERMEALKEDMQALFGYYGSEDWFADREAELPEGTKAGVLSEWIFAMRLRLISRENLLRKI